MEILEFRALFCPLGCKGLRELYIHRTDLCTAQWKVDCTLVRKPDLKSWLIQIIGWKSESSVFRLINDFIHLKILYFVIEFLNRNYIPTEYRRRLDISGSSNIKEMCGITASKFLHILMLLIITCNMLFFLI